MDLQYFNSRYLYKICYIILCLTRLVLASKWPVLPDQPRLEVVTSQKDSFRFTGGVMVGLVKKHLNLSNSLYRKERMSMSFIYGTNLAFHL